MRAGDVVDILGDSRQVWEIVLGGHTDDVALREVYGRLKRVADRVEESLHEGQCALSCRAATRVKSGCRNERPRAAIDRSRRAIPTGRG